MQMKWIHEQLIIINENCTCSDELFATLYISKKTRYKYYCEGKIRINCSFVHQNTPLSKGDQIHFDSIADVQDEHINPSFDELGVVYEDDLFLIVNKKPHQIIHNDGVSKETTLYDQVKGYYLLQGYSCPVRAIHRLDKETSGMVIFCKITILQPLLDQMLKEKQIRREYCAVCAGVIEENQLRVDAGIARDRHHNGKMRIASNGKEATTDVLVKQRFRKYTQVECRLHQGRTHQIRVHLASLGHPILHDTLYGNSDTDIPRLALHASRVVLFHPLKQKKLIIECPLPDDIKKLLQK